MKRENYERARIIITSFDVEDVITTSTINFTPGDNETGLDG